MSVIWNSLHLGSSEFGLIHAFDNDSFDFFNVDTEEILQWRVRDKHINSTTFIFSFVHNYSI